MMNLRQLENKIKTSSWWQLAAAATDSHHSNESGVMLTHHLLAVHENVVAIFQKSDSVFYNDLFYLLQHLQLDKTEVEEELKLIALLHDIGKIGEDKTLVIPHPLTGKPAHKRHGLVSLMAAMEILAGDLDASPEKRNRIYRTVELHDISYGLFREYKNIRIIPAYERWAYINNKIHPVPATGLLYLLIFKLADIHGHADIADVLWFYNTVNENYFRNLNIQLPIPAEQDIR